MRITLVTVGVMLALLAGVAPLQAQVKSPGSDTVVEYNGKTLPQWIKEIKDPDPGIAEAAIQAVTQFGPDAAKEAGPALVDALGYNDASLRVNAAIALSILGVHESLVPKAVSALERRVSEDPQSIVRLYAAVTLGRMEMEARPAIPNLILASKDQGSWEIRRAAVYALGQVGRAADKDHPVSMPAAHALIAVFSGAPPSQYADRSAEVRLAAVMALGSLGIPGDPRDQALIVQGLNKALNDREKAIQIWARVGLMSLAVGDPTNDPHKLNDAIETQLVAICKFLKGNDFTAHLQAIRALGIMGDKARAHIPELIEELGDKEPVLVGTAAWALGEMGTSAARAEPILNNLLENKDTSEPVKMAVKEALEKINGKPKK